jgi:S1-C subfamily serine protease
MGEKIGLKVGDVIVSASGKATSCPKDLAQALQTGGWPEKAITLEMERAGKISKITVPAKPELASKKPASASTEKSKSETSTPTQTK